MRGFRVRRDNETAGESLSQTGRLPLNRYVRLIPAGGALLVVLMVFLWMGCGKETATAPQKSADVDALSIIVDPLSPAPGDTAWLTVQPVGSGGTPVYNWRVDEGTLISNASISVQWVVPDAKGIYRVAVKVAIGSAIDTISKYVMVRDCESIDTGIRFSFNPRVSDTDFIIFGSNISPSNPLFVAYNAYQVGLQTEQITINGDPTVDGGFDLQFVGNTLVSSVITNYNSFLRQQSYNVILFPLRFGTKRFVSNNDAGGSIYRKNQHTKPDATADLSKVVWQMHLVGPSEDGTKDLVNIAYRKLTEPIKTLTTSQDSTEKNGLVLQRYYRNVVPMFTPNERNILYFTDTTGTFEPCIIQVDPVNGPVIGSNRELGGPGRHGIFFNSGVTVSEKTVFEWNPAAETELGFVDASGKFCILDYADSSVQVVSSVGKITEFAWSFEGEAAVITKAGVLIVTPGGAPDTVFVKERVGDQLVGVNWSFPGVGEKSIGFRMVRRGISAQESFCALVIYSLERKQWYYVSPRIPASAMEPSVDYRWLRVMFDVSSGGGLYAAIPTVRADGGDAVTVYHSH
jgi:hypothetical protein